MQSTGEALLSSVAPGSSARRSTAAAVRAVFVIVSATIALVVFLPTLGLAWNDRGETGFRLDTVSGEVLDVRSGSPASRAGIRPGDVVRAAALTPRTRILLFDVEAVPPDTRVTLHVQRGVQLRTVTLITERVAANHSLLDYAVFALQTVTYALFVITGAALVLLQPSLMTWALYAYCLYGPNP